MPSLTAVILAAGQGTRMRSELPKMLHPLCGRPLVGWPIAAALEAGADRVVVVDAPDDRSRASCPRASSRVVQPEPNGTGGAVQAAAAQIDADGDRRRAPRRRAAHHRRAIAAARRRTPRIGAAATMATMVLDDPTGYGRVVRDDDGDVERVVETKAAGDATRRAARDPRGQQRDLRLRRRPRCSPRSTA